MKTILSIVTLAAVCIGCVSTGRPIDSSKLSQVKRGESSRTDVESLLGHPQSIMQSEGPDGTETMLLYQYLFASPRGESFIPIVGAFVGGANTRLQTATITIGKDGKVSKIASSFGADEMKTGVAVNMPSTNATPRTPQQSWQH